MNKSDKSCPRDRDWGAAGSLILSETVISGRKCLLMPVISVMFNDSPHTFDPIVKHTHRFRWLHFIWQVMDSLKKCSSSSNWCQCRAVFIWSKSQKHEGARSGESGDSRTRRRGFSSKTRLTVLENWSPINKVHHRSRSAKRPFLWEELVDERLRNLTNEIITVEIALRCWQVHHVKPGLASSNYQGALPHLKGRSHFRRDSCLDALHDVSCSYSRMNQLSLSAIKSANYFFSRAPSIGSGLWQIAICH
jgi:hypothetical protein